MAQRKKRRDARTVKGGYEKIAYGGVNDAVRLLFSKEPDLSALDGLDLYNIAEIRRLKDGLEIKFYDRMKALECLRELGERGGESSPLYRALAQCAKGIGEEKGHGV